MEDNYNDNELLECYSYLNMLFPESNDRIASTDFNIQSTIDMQFPPFITNYMETSLFSMEIEDHVFAATNFELLV